MISWSSLPIRRFFFFILLNIFGHTAFAERPLLKPQGLQAELDQVLSKFNDIMTIAKCQEILAQAAYIYHSLTADRFSLRPALSDQDLQLLLSSAERLNALTRSKANELAEDPYQAPNIKLMESIGGYFFGSLQIIRAFAKNRAFPKDTLYQVVLSFEERDLLAGLDHGAVYWSNVDLGKRIRALSHHNKRLSVEGLVYLHFLAQGYFDKDETTQTVNVRDALLARIASEFKTFNAGNSIPHPLSPWRELGHEQRPYLALVGKQFYASGEALVGVRDTAQAKVDYKFLTALVQTLVILRHGEAYINLLIFEPFTQRNDLSDDELALASALVFVCRGSAIPGVRSLGKALLKHIRFKYYFTPGRIKSTIEQLSRSHREFDEAVTAIEEEIKLDTNLDAINDKLALLFETIDRFYADSDYVGPYHMIPSRILSNEAQRYDAALARISRQLIDRRLAAFQEQTPPVMEAHARISPWAMAALKHKSPDAFQYFAAFGFPNLSVGDASWLAIERPNLRTTHATALQRALEKTTSIPPMIVHNTDRCGEGFNGETVAP